MKEKLVPPVFDGPRNGVLPEFEKWVNGDESDQGVTITALNDWQQNVSPDSVITSTTLQNWSNKIHLNLAAGDHLFHIKSNAQNGGHLHVHVPLAAKLNMDNSFLEVLDVKPSVEVDFVFFGIT